jgi:hypothetical protein
MMYSTVEPKLYFLNEVDSSKNILIFLASVRLIGDI